MMMIIIIIIIIYLAIDTQCNWSARTEEIPIIIRQLEPLQNHSESI